MSGARTAVFSLNLSLSFGAALVFAKERVGRSRGRHGIATVGIRRGALSSNTYRRGSLWAASSLCGLGIRSYLL
jgi:hypothetical protein